MHTIDFQFLSIRQPITLGYRKSDVLIVPTFRSSFMGTSPGNWISGDVGEITTYSEERSCMVIADIHSNLRLSGVVILQLVNDLRNCRSPGVTLLFVVLIPWDFTLSSFGAFEIAHLMHAEAFPDSLGPSPVMNRGLAIFAGFLVSVGCLQISMLGLIRDRISIE